MTSAADLIASTSSISEAEAVVVAVEAAEAGLASGELAELLAALTLVPWVLIAALTILAVSSLLSWTNVE